MLLLLPAAVLAENLDGAETINSIGVALEEWAVPLCSSITIALIAWGASFLFKKKPSFKKALYRTCYIIALIPLAGYALGILLGFV